MRPSHEMFAIMNLLLWALGLQCFTLNLLGSAYEIDGTLEYSILDPAGNRLKSKAFAFTLAVKDDKWFVSTTAVNPREEPVYQYNVGFDGINIYILGILSEQFDPQVAFAGLPPGLPPQTSTQPTVNLSNSQNQAVGEIYSRTIPFGEPSFAAPLWLAYASSKYADTAPSNKFVTAWIDDQKFVTNVAAATWAKYNSAPFLPRAIDYFNEGYGMRYESTGVATKIPHSPPFNKGYLEGKYQVMESTNMAGLVLPTHFALTSYGPIGTAQAASDVRPIARIEGRATLLRMGSSRDKFIPWTPEGKRTAVSDYRVGIAPGNGTSLQYLLGPGPMFGQKEVKAMIAGKESAKAFALNLKRLIMIVMLLSICVAVAYKYLRREKHNINT